MINTQVLKGNLIRQDYTTAFTLNQGDKGVPFKVELLENGTPYTLLDTDTVSIEWLKPNGQPFLQDGNIKYGTNYIEITTPEAISQYAGSGTFNIIIADGDVRKGTIRREYKVVATSMAPGSASEDTITDAMTELRELNSTLAATIQTGNLDNYAKKTYVNKEVELINSSLEDITNFRPKTVDIDYFIGTDTQKLNNAIAYCKTNGATLYISRKLEIDSAITTYDFSFNIEGTCKDSEICCTSSTILDVFFDITAPTGVVYKTKIANLTINANKKAKICTWLRKGKSNCFDNVTIKFSTDKDFVIGYDATNKVIELSCKSLYVIGGELTDDAELSNYNIYTHGSSSDCNFEDITCVNASQNNIWEDAWSNQWVNVHTYGYPLTKMPVRSLYITGGFSTWTNVQLDGFQRQGLLIKGHYLEFNNIKLQTPLDLYPTAGGISIDTLNTASDNISFNNVMLKKFRTTDTEYYAYDITVTDKFLKTIHINNIINDRVEYNNRITNLYQQVVRIPQNITEFDVSFPVELLDNNYMVFFNCNWDFGKIVITSKGTNKVSFRVDNAPTWEYGEPFNFMLKYQLNATS